MPSVTYQATLRSLTKGGTNPRTEYASQEYYSNSADNWCGILHFSQMKLGGKNITAISITATGNAAGPGGTQTAYVRKSNYQESDYYGATGASFAGSSLGTYTASYRGKTTTTQITGSLLSAMAAYFSEGNNTICLYNPSPSSPGSNGTPNYFRLTSVSITIEYSESVSEPSASATNVVLGSSVVIYTNRASTSTTHRVVANIEGDQIVIGSNVGDSVTWTPSITLATYAPNSTSISISVDIESYYGDSKVGTRTIYMTLEIPESVKPSISSFAWSELDTTYASTYGSLIRGMCRVQIKTVASGARGSTISSIVVSIGSERYSGDVITTGYLNDAGTITASVVVTDSRGRTASSTLSFSVIDYTRPSISLFTAERCNSAGTAAQKDGTYIRISASAAVDSLGGKNSISASVWHKLSSSSSWIKAATLSTSNYALNVTNQRLSQTFNVASGYDIELRVSDNFTTMKYPVRVGTKQVGFDMYAGGNGFAVGQMCEHEYAFEIRPEWDMYYHGRVVADIVVSDTEPSSPTVGLIWFKPKE